MVQVDVIWSYAFGASFAAASARQLANEPRVFHNKPYNTLVHFLAILFAPSGLYLLWQFPQWETMQVATTHSDLSSLLVTLFAVTNITQGMVGFYVGYRLIRRGNFYGAHVNWMISWILFWFVLVCGWDTLGWQRFLYDASMVGGKLWTPGEYMGVGFFKSNVFLSLITMGFIFYPWLWFGIVRANYVGLRQDRTLSREQKASIHTIFALALGTPFVTLLALAIIASLIVMGFVHLTSVLWLGYVLGLAVAILLGYLLLFRRGMPLHRLARVLYVKDRFDP